METSNLARLIYIQESIDSKP